MRVDEKESRDQGPKDILENRIFMLIELNNNIPDNIFIKLAFLNFGTEQTELLIKLLEHPNIVIAPIHISFRSQPF